MRLAPALALLSILAVIVPVCLAADVTGVWKSGLRGRQGQNRPYTFELQQAPDGTLTGVVAGFRSEGKVQDGKVEGDKIRFSAENKYFARDVLMTFTGTVAGDRMKLTVTFEDSDEKIDIVAVKQK